MQPESVATDILSVISKDIFTKSHAIYFLKIIELLDDSEIEAELTHAYLRAIDEMLFYPIQGKKTGSLDELLVAFRKHCVQYQLEKTYNALIQHYDKDHLSILKEYITLSTEYPNEFHSLSIGEISEICELFRAQDSADGFNFKKWLIESNIFIIPNENKADYYVELLIDHIF